ncbi:MAG TPA: creatininase family protein [Anaerolineae bacterium]|nr:creatininase family protein [Anaerolineae bacterium]
MPTRYAELLPDELARLWQERPLACCAWGALEWHGPHLPLGLDGLVAERFAERLADRAGGALLPSVWLPITTLPHPLSLSIHADVVKGIWRDGLNELYRAGARVICLISGHYAQGHLIELYNASVAAMRSHPDLCVLSATPLEVLGNGAYLDHAGRWETAQLMAVRPDLVHLEKFPGMLGAQQVAVLGDDPRLARPEDGAAVTVEALNAWAAWIEQSLNERNQAPLFKLYEERIAAYADYVQRYYAGSWEEAIQKWWAERS